MAPHRLAICVCLAAAVPGALASVANSGPPSGQFVLPGMMDDDLRVITGSGTGAGGSGTLFGIKKVARSGGGFNYLFAVGTAAHVLDKVAEFKLGFVGPGGTAFVATDSGNHTKAADGKEDLGFLGMTVNDAIFTVAQKAYLDGLTPLTPDEDITSVGHSMTSYGYGGSGDTWTDATTGATKGFLFTKPTYGTHRYIKADIFEYVSAYAPDPYEYPAMKWMVKSDPMYGSTYKGDSGGTVIDGKKWVGENTLSFFFKDTASGYDAITYGLTNVALQFSAKDDKWLTDQKAMYFGETPEPSPLPALALPALLMLRRRARRSVVSA